jgi:glycosyltransferase involved in cell wall biosynthesis
LVAHFAYGALTGGVSGHVGGVERQTSLMARWLAARGHRVSLVTWDEGQRDGEVIDGVRVFKVCRQDAGLPGLRFLHPRWTSLNAAMRRADAAVYYQNCGEYVTGQVALWTRRHRRRFVYSVANDLDCDWRLPAMRNWRERVLYRHGLRHSDRILTQTASQARMLRDGFGCEAGVIPMPCPGPSVGEFVPPVPPGPEARVLWVGRVCEVKRPDRLLELARACPEIGFDIAGPGGDDPYSRAILERAAAEPNLRVLGRIPRAEMPRVYREAALLCCTSDAEGFPNTFLEAWSFGLPVVSTFDPDGLIATEGLGAAARSVSSLAAAVRRLLGDRAAWERCSHNARRRWLAHHTVDEVMSRFELVFCEASSPKAGARR